MNYAEQIARELSLSPQNVQGAIDLIDAGNTIPFIARYRKEATGSMDDQALRALGDRLEYLRGLDKRKAEVEASITEQGALTSELARSIAAAQTLAEVEDLYRPYKPKRKTRASIARARGLQPLADAIFAQDASFDPAAAATAYLGDEVHDAAAALAGAQDILAEQISDDARCRAELRRYYQAFGQIKSTQAKQEDSVYAPYYDASEPLAKIPGHRVLALDRGEREGYLKVSITVDAERAAAITAWMFARKKTGGASALLVEAAARDAYTRLIHPSLENELRAALTARADEGAIVVFGDNLRQLLLQPPITGKVVLGLDPGYRMGCKLAVVDPTGKVLDTGVVYPVPEFKRVDQAKAAVKGMVLRHGVELMAIGNGTASRETEQFAADVIRELAAEHGLRLQYMVVSEAGASVYSASKLAAEEFPQFDVNLRSAVSIARRLQDPLAETCQDRPQSHRRRPVPARYAPKEAERKLLTALLRIASTRSASISTLPRPRCCSGWPASRRQRPKILSPGGRRRARSLPAPSSKRSRALAPKRSSSAPASCGCPGPRTRSTPPPSTPKATPPPAALLEACGFAPAEIGTPAMQQLPARIKAKGEKALCESLGIGLPTLQDIAAELCRPGRDVRDSLPKPLLRSDVMGMEDLTPGMELVGTVRNVIDFGAFVDIGVHQDGLVHISQIADRFVKHPRDLLKVGQRVRVKVLEVNPAKKRIALS